MTDDTDELELLQRLIATPAIFSRIAATAGSEFQLQERLRSEFDAELVRAALALQTARAKAVDKFRLASRMWFTSVGLEQATSERVAAHKAQRFTGEVWDLCCGIGGDAIALAARGPVVAVDRSAANCLRARSNVELYVKNPQLEVRTSDVRKIVPDQAWIHVDPDRRTKHGTRTLRLEFGSPPLVDLLTMMETARGGAIKVSPAANFGGKFSDAEVELVSLNGECKEATIWFGELAEPGLFRATSLPSGETLTGYPLDVPIDQRLPGRYVFDPDPAVVRAGLVNHLAEAHQLWRLDDEEEYLSGDAIPDSAFVQAFEIEDVLSTNEKLVRNALRDKAFGQLEIKARHLKIDVEATRRRMPLNGENAGVLLYARIAGKSRTIVARRLPRWSDGNPDASVGA